jgi:alkylresorcinol/alkylpyrone synthase
MTKMGKAAREFLGGHGLNLTDIDRFICHPGGPRVIDALEHAFELSPGVLGDARAVLRDYGNMSAASVLFVLERALESRWRRGLMTALGPGFTAGFAVLSRG